MSEDLNRKLDEIKESLSKVGGKDDTIKHMEAADSVKLGSIEEMDFFEDELKDIDHMTVMVCMCIAYKAKDKSFMLYNISKIN